MTSYIASPRFLGARQGHEAGDRWLAAFEIAVQEVDGETPAAAERPLRGGVQGVSGIAKGGLPSAGVAGGDVQVSLLMGEVVGVWGRVAAAVASGPKWVGGDSVGRVGVEMVSIEVCDPGAGVTQ